ncbi:MAG: hypothetical protein HY862_14355 [Chloroflexi bacterium]|nr:hypothetical protein [Chloroflexota bacterium]
MRISIWQQFASNHSNSFTVVGEFESVEAAQNAAEQLRQSLKPIIEWRMARAEEIWESFEATPIEIEVGQQWGVEWLNHHEWLESERSLNAIKTFENYVILGEGETWAGQEPFDEILLKLGAKVSAESGLGNTSIMVNITCHFLNSDAADKVLKIIRDYLAAKKEFLHKNPIPWIGYIRGEKQPNIDELERLDQIYSDREKAELRYFRENESLRNKMNEHDFQSEEAIKYRVQYSKLLEQMLERLPALTDDEKMLIVGARFSAGYMGAKEILLNEQKLEIVEAYFGIGLQGIPAFFAWLKDNGCHTLHYTIVEKLR